jgi:hypothetical protein
MQNLALQIEPGRTVPELKGLDPPLYMTGIQVRGIGSEDWEAFPEDFSRHYSTDSRWCGGRFTVWTLKKYDGYKLTVRRSGYLDIETGATSSAGGRGRGESRGNFQVNQNYDEPEIKEMSE